MNNYEYENIKKSFFSNSTVKEEYPLYSQLFLNLIIKEQLQKFILKKTFIENILLSLFTIFTILSISFLLFGNQFRIEIYFFMIFIGVIISYFINKFIQLDHYSFISKKTIYKKFYQISSISEAEIIFLIVLNRYPGFFIPISYFSQKELKQDILITDITKLNILILNAIKKDYSSFLTPI